MSAISAIYFLDRKGRVIIFRNYRGEVDQDISEGFCDKVLELEILFGLVITTEFEC